MASETAKAVAQDVIKARKKGGKIVLGEIMENRGYKKATIKNPKNVTETKSFQEVIKPLLESYHQELQEVLSAMKGKDKSKEQYRVLVEAADKIQKQIQLLSGKATETINIKPFDELPENHSIQEDKGPKAKNKGGTRGNSGGQDHRDIDALIEPSST